MEIDARKIKALCELSDEDFAKVLRRVARSSGSDPRTVENIAKNAPMIKKMLSGATENELAMVCAMLKKKNGSL